MHAELVMVGTELLLGQIVDTNAAFIAQTLAENGVAVFRKTTVGDNRARIVQVLDEALERSRVVLVSGGLGPTEDDLTRECVAELLGQPLETHEELLRQIEARFARIGRPMTSNNLKQAQLPRGAQAIENPHGTAPGILVDGPRGVIVCMPGVPSELEPMLVERVIPYLRAHFGIQGTIHSRVLKVCGMGESKVDEVLGDLVAASANPTIGLLASPDVVRIRLTSRAASVEAAQDLTVPLEAEIRRRLAGCVMGADDETLEGVVDALLRARGWTLAVAETYTGGMIAKRLSAAGARSFVGGLVMPSWAGRGGVDAAREALLYCEALSALAVVHDETTGQGLAAWIGPDGQAEWLLRRADPSEAGQIRGAVAALEQLRRHLTQQEGNE